MNHPLTDELTENISSFYLSDMGETGEGIRQDMRASADWQLEQVLRFMEENGFGIRKILLLKDAMRPQRQKDN